MRRAALAPVVGTLAVAALLSGAAAYTVHRSGCDDPGRYVTINGRIELIGGCLKPGDLPVGPAPAIHPDSEQNGAQVRP